ncbi:hypothetical protein [Actinomadura gamaensis]|uniref:RNase H type-1 domain-containing protein n=1 Tax=Actinomadura gamaensis TaxID=1763541 RepID=A0ABV9U3C2_9ACTN
MTPLPLPLRWFEEELRVLPAELAVRAQRMRAGATRGYGCTACAVVRQALGLGFAAARHDDGEWAERLVAEAEHYADHGAHAANCATASRRPVNVMVAELNGVAPLMEHAVLAETMARCPRMKVAHVYGRRGHPLNETADSLASIARWRLTQRFDTAAAPRASCGPS